MNFTGVSLSCRDCLFCVYFFVGEACILGVISVTCAPIVKDTLIIET